MIPFKNRGLGTQIGAALENFCEHNNLDLRECGIGSFQEASGRDAHRAWCIEAKSKKLYYIYLQVAYMKDPVSGFRISKVSSIVLFEFGTKTTLAKTHLNSVDDIKGFYPQIESYLL